MSDKIEGQSAVGSATAVQNNHDDDVILIEPVIPIIDLCSPSNSSGFDRAWFQIDSFCKQNPMSNSSNSSKLLKKPVAKAPVTQAPVARSNSIRCGICLLSPIDRKPHATPCGHVFCDQCIRHSLIFKKACPKCKKFVCSSQIFALYI